MKSKFTSILLSVCIAFGLWLYVVYNVSQEDTNTFYNIDIVYEGESILHERGLMLTSASTHTATLELTGKRTDLNKINSDNITIKADLSKIYAAGNRISIDYDIAYPGDVAKNAFTEESRSPVYINVEERRNNKEIPVEINWIGSAPEGFMSDRENRVLDHATVLITGPASVADLIEKAVIEVDLTEQRESISQSYRYTLCDAEDNAIDAAQITTNVEEIRLDVKILQVKDMTLTYTLVEGGGANKDNTTITLSNETIRVSGSEAVLESMGDSIHLGTIDLSTITKDDTLTFPITLPEGVTNETGVTEVQAAVAFGKNLTTREISVNEIQGINVPEGLEVDIITEKLTITIRGAAVSVAKLRVEDITVTVDFTDAEIGTSTFKATITLSDDAGSVGVVGSCYVSATVQEK